MNAKDYTNTYKRKQEAASGLAVDREPVYGTKKRDVQIAAESKVEELGREYSELTSFLTKEAKDLRYEINRLRGL